MNTRKGKTRNIEKGRSRIHSTRIERRQRALRFSTPTARGTDDQHKNAASAHQNNSEHQCATPILRDAAIRNFVVFDPQPRGKQAIIARHRGCHITSYSTNTNIKQAPTLTSTTIKNNRDTNTNTTNTIVTPTPTPTSLTTLPPPPLRYQHQHYPHQQHQPQKHHHRYNPHQRHCHNK